MGRRRQKRSKRSKKGTIRPKKHLEREDRFSGLPNDLIHRILSFADAKDTVQTSILSTRWRNVWKSMSHLNFNRSQFVQKTDFENFVADFLSHRDDQSDLSVFNLTCSNEIFPRELLSQIISYGASHNLQQLNFSSEVFRVPPSVFTIQSLKHLSLSFNVYHRISLLNLSLDLPALTTLVFQQVYFQLSWINGTNKLDFFSKLPNLENLSLVDCQIMNRGVFDINSATLKVLHIKFQIMNARSEYLISAPKLSLFKFEGSQPILITADDLTCLDTLSLNVGEFHYQPWKTEDKQDLCEKLINLFHQFRDAKFVIVGLQTIELLSWVLELLENQTCPFRKMEYLKVEDMFYWGNIKFPTGTLTYLSNGSPRCTLINTRSHNFASP